MSNEMGPTKDEIIESLKNEVRQVRLEYFHALTALGKLVYKDGGKYRVGLYGDSDVTDIVGKVLK